MLIYHFGLNKGKSGGFAALPTANGLKTTDKALYVIVLAIGR